MNKQQVIEQILQVNGISYSGRLAEDIFDDTHFYVFIEVTRNSENLQVPSNKKLKDVKDEVSNAGINIDFILTDATKKGIEEGLRASMLHSFPDFVRNSFLSMNGTKAQVWLAPKVSVPDEVFKEINDKIGVYLTVFNIEEFSVELTSSANLPSKTVCLSVIRGNSPANLENITAILRSRHFTVPSLDWLSRLLDSLRRHGMIIRSKSGYYSLSLQGLKALGTSKGRASPDVTKILALARSGE